MTRIDAGLCSVTFRGLETAAVAAAAGQAGIDAIEWGGDVHVPLGDLDAAEHAARATAAAGLVTASYGSYVFASQMADDTPERLVDTAVALGAPNARVWCPFGVLPGGDAETRAEVAADLERICTTAADAGLTISLEFHSGTLTQSAESATRLVDEVGATNLFTYWQPIEGADAETSLAELEAVHRHLSHIHVFRWRADGSRLPLDEGADLWPATLRAVAGGFEQERWQGARVAFLEFVRDDDPDQFRRDSETLRAWLLECERA